MADTKLSALTAATTLDDADELYVNDSGTSKRITYANLKSALLNRANHTGTDDDPLMVSGLSEVTVAAGDYLIILDVSTSPVSLKKILASDFATAAQANATHGGDAAGATTLTLQAAAISGKAEVTAVGTDYVLILDTSVSPHALKKALLSDVLDNATHTGQVTGSAALTVQPAAVSEQTLATAVGTDYVLILDTSDSPNTLKKALVSDLGGALAASDISGQSAATAVAGDYFLILDTSDSPNALKKALVSDVLDNATHSGEVSGSGALTVQPAAIANRTGVTVASGDQLLILDVSDSPNTLKRVSASDFATAAQANATHTGQVSGATVLTVQPAAISEQSSVTVAAGDQLLILDVSDSPNTLKRVTASDFATAAQANATHSFSKFGEVRNPL